VAVCGELPGAGDRSRGVAAAPPAGKLLTRVRWAIRARHYSPRTEGAYVHWVRRFVLSQKVTYPVALDPRLTIGNRYGFKGTPYTVVIDRKGEMVARIHGESAVSRLPRLLDDLLARRAH
jgi:hypothetical protein